MHDLKSVIFPPNSGRNSVIRMLDKNFDSLP